MFQANLDEKDTDPNMFLLGETPPFTGFTSSDLAAEVILDPEQYLSKCGDPRWDESCNEASYQGIPNSWAYFSSEQKGDQQSFFEGI